VPTQASPIKAHFTPCAAHVATATGLQTRAMPLALRDGVSDHVTRRARSMVHASENLPINKLRTPWNRSVPLPTKVKAHDSGEID
jgi:hypothetical protein